MPFNNAEVRRRYMREYMRERYALDKAFRDRVAMRADKHRLKIALNRLEKARWKEAENPGSVAAWELSLGAQWNQVERESKGRVKA